MLVAPALLAAAVAIATAVCVAGGARRIGEPFPGFLVARNRTVLSVARADWPLELAPRALFAQVVAAGGRPVDRAEEIERDIAGLAERTPVTYRLRKGSDVFDAAVPVQRFSVADFLAFYGTYASIGLFFAIAGLIALGQAVRARDVRPSVLAFFLVCQFAALTLGTAGGVYGPYGLTPVYFTAQCLVFASMLHLAASFPHPLGARSRWRPVALAAVYGAAIGLAVLLETTSDHPSLFLPLVYVLYLLLANAIFVYAARLAIELSLPTSDDMRASLRRALAGVVLVVVLPVMIFLVYPALERTVSPVVLVGPFALFPLLTAAALAVQRRDRGLRPATSVRLRLSLLFLAAVETSFLIAVAVFWQNNSWAQLLAERTLNQRQQALVERLTASPAPPTGADLAALDGLVQTVEEGDLARQSASAASAGDGAGLRGSLARLADIYAGIGARLEQRQRWVGSLDTTVLATLLAIAVLQAVLSMLAVRRWLIGPIDSIAAATGVIATGDLAHRIELDASEEFTALAASVNAMAASLQSINRRVEAARAARQRAAGAARDAERRRLARELHDGILQDLSAVRLRLEAAADDGARRRLVGDSVEGIAEVIAAIRRVVDDLRPSGLGELTLEQAIAGHARLLAFAHNVQLSLDLSGAASVPDWAMRDVYRIAQEASANAIRHASPAHLAIRLVQSEGETTLEVADDGAGFDPDAVAAGSGLHGMRERAAALGGDLEIRSAAGRGATIRLALRVPAASA
ncbi:MAG TPA: ATP-binding protein [Candidatus Binatia bacterium]|nr:ATP-binding protein [Candidatus Binatia bacterium]